jgi:hypothetical protein
MDDWACDRCGDHFWGDPPDDLLCGGCIQELEQQQDQDGELEAGS